MQSSSFNYRFSAEGLLPRTAILRNETLASFKILYNEVVGIRLTCTNLFGLSH